ncbi:hypothetical protein WA026_019226 [Henosepilachna vigintioctopunctata]|uniref:Nucleoporin p58/p45 n=1 Tax=Henosepilachna vigintioctopunctata TaxID=420089 RepID=A0AAW1V2E8_9CUCU
MPSGFSFGAKTTAPSFGNTNTSTFGSAPTSQFSFGSNTQQQPPAFQLGTNLSKPTSSVLPQPGGFSLGVSSLAPTTFATATTSSGGLPLNAAPTTTLNFLPNTSTTVTSGLSFGATTATPTLNFGLSTTGNAGTGSLTFGVPAASKTSATPTTGSLGSITTALPSTGLSFGVSSSGSNNTFASSTSTPGTLSFGTPAVSTGFSLVTPTSVAAASQKVGLGGVQTSTANTLGNVAAKEIPPKEQQVPNEIQQDIENFKNFIKQQKSYSSDVSRCCVKDFRSVEAQIGVLNNIIKEIESQLQRNRSLAEKLKYDTAQGLQLLEMAQRTQDTPAGLQYENVAPMNFFLTLADNFEKEMHALKIQIENTDKYVKNFGQPATLTSQDLTLGMRRLHDTFVALAGRLQSVHTQVESQKSSTLIYANKLLMITVIPLKFWIKNLHQANLLQLLSNFSITPQQNVGNTGASVTPGFGFGSSTNTLFGNTSTFNTSNPGFQNTTLGTGLGFQNTSLGSSFQLQKPPTGNKRGKQ